MSPRLIISDNRDDPGNPLVLDGEAIDAAASDPVAIGKLMVDQVWAEGTDPTGGGPYYERSSNRHRRLQAFETGSEDFMTGGWVRVLVTPGQLERERAGMEQAASRGLVSIHGTRRGVLLVEFLDVAWSWGREGRAYGRIFDGVQRGRGSVPCCWAWPCSAASMPSALLAATR